ncbi:hypothetical protein VNF293_37110 [Atlantibacter hermannii]
MIIGLSCINKTPLNKQQGETPAYYCALFSTKNHRKYLQDKWVAATDAGDGRSSGQTLYAGAN